MGRQVNFFTSFVDEQKLIEMILESGGKIMDTKANPLTLQELLNRKPIWIDKKPDATAIIQFYIYFDNSKIIQSDNGYVEYYSDVIKFSRCEVKNDNQIWNGRIWYETQYYDENANIIKTPEWLTKRFNEYKRWIVKRYNIDVDKMFYIGEDTYRLYKAGTYRMMNSETVSIEFD